MQANCQILGFIWICSCSQNDENAGAYIPLPRRLAGSLVVFNQRVVNLGQLLGSMEIPFSPPPPCPAGQPAALSGAVTNYSRALID
jgi:hypothetical protein